MNLIDFRSVREDANRAAVEKIKQDAAAGDPVARDKLAALKAFHVEGKRANPSWYVLNPWFDFGD